MLNHVGGSRAGVAGIYQRHDWKLEKREALDLWNGHVCAILARGDEAVEMPDTAVEDTNKRSSNISERGAFIRPEQSIEQIGEAVAACR